MNQGALITFEGGDGSGKSTHIKFLSRLLTSLGFDVVLVREPGGTPLGEKLREILLDIGNDGMSSRSELLIYEAARAQLIDDVIAPAIADGKVVLCDRFTDSTIAYQGYGRGIDTDIIRRLNDFAADGIVPDATIVLHCANREEKRDRVDRRDEKDRLELAGGGFHTRVIEAFRDLADEEPDRVTLVDTGGVHSQTAQAIFAALADVLPVLVDGSVDLAPVLAAYDEAHSDDNDREAALAALDAELDRLTAASSQGTAIRTSEHDGGTAHA